jgi:hypothetical protein
MLCCLLRDCNGSLYLFLKYIWRPFSINLVGNRMANRGDFEVLIDLYLSDLALVENMMANRGDLAYLR